MDCASGLYPLKGPFVPSYHSIRVPPREVEGRNTEVKVEVTFYHRRRDP